MSSLACAPSDAISIRDVARQYDRERIIVGPLLWTARHVQLLGFNFTEPWIIPSLPLPPCAVGFNYKRWNHDAENIKDGRILSVIAPPHVGSFPLKVRPKLHFLFDRKVIKALPCHALTTKSENTLVAVYAKAGDFQSQRARAMSVTKPAHPTIKSKRLKKLRMITPSKPLQDPFVVALLITQARAERWFSRKSNDLTKKSHQCRVLYDYGEKDPRHLHVFCSEIPWSLLDRLDYPSRACPEPWNAMDIQHVAIPYSPPENFRYRLMTTILPEYRYDEDINMEDGWTLSCHFSSRV